MLGGTGDNVQCGWEGQTFGADHHPDPTRPRGGWRSAYALQAQQSQPPADPVW